MDVSGVRNSWEASAKNRRSLFSDAALAPNASSIFSIIVLNAMPSWPTSEPGVTRETRWVRSPSAMAPAVTAISSRGRISRRTMIQEMSPRIIKTNADTMISMSNNRCRVLSRPVNGCATTMVPTSSVSGRANAR